MSTRCFIGLSALDTGWDRPSGSSSCPLAASHPHTRHLGSRLPCAACSLALSSGTGTCALECFVLVVELFLLLLLFLIHILFWICVRDSRLEKRAWLFQQNLSRLEMPPSSWGRTCCLQHGSTALQRPLGLAWRRDELPAFIL